MKTLKFAPIPVLVLTILLVRYISISTSSTLSITVKTGKPSYQLGQDIYVCGKLTYDGSPIPETLVAIEVQNPNNDTVVTRTRQTNADGTYNLTFKLPTDARLGTYTVYVGSSYKGETATNKTTFGLVQIVQTTVKIAGKEYTIIIESNATITDVTATRNSLHFKTSGPTGETAYINTTFPVGLNKTEIKVFVDGEKITPPPYPIIITNGTHYFIYFEFTCSTHEITIQYAITNVAITNITLSKEKPIVNETIQIYISVENQGNYTETFDVYLNYTRIYDPIIGTQHITLQPGQLITLNFTWTPTTSGSYQLIAYTSEIEDDMIPADNMLTLRIYVSRLETGSPQGGAARLSHMNLLR